MVFTAITEHHAPVLKQGRCCRMLVTLLSLWFLATPLRSEPESAVKAAYLYNFAILVKWPETAFAKPDSPMIIGVVGRDPFSGGLGSILAGRSVGAHPLVVRNVPVGNADALRACKIVFVTVSESVKEVTSAVKGLPVLIVGEDEDFALHGGIIGFVVRNQKIKLEINAQAARQAHLSIPSDLLGIAKIVDKP